MLKMHEFTPKQTLSVSNGGNDAEVTTIHLDGTPRNDPGTDTSSSAVGKVIPVSILMTASHDEDEEEESKGSSFQKSSEYRGVFKGEGNPMHGGKSASPYYSDETPPKQSKKPDGGSSALIGNQQPPRGFVNDDDKYFIV